MRGAKRVREVARSLRKGGHLYAQGAVRLLANTLDSLELLIHPFERLLERAHVTRQPSVGELEEARAVRIERLRRERLDRRCEAVVHDGSLRGELRVGSRQVPLQLDYLLSAPVALCQRRAYGDVDA